MHLYEEDDEDEQYFDVPIQYRPTSLFFKQNKPMRKEMNEVIKTEDESTIFTVEATKKLCASLMQTPHYQKIGAEGIFAIVQKAKAIGVDPLDALNGGMYYVQGKVEMTAAMMNDLIRRHGHSIVKDKSSDATVCILHGKRKDNGDTWCESFSIEDAKLAGIYRNQWLKYPKDMLFARALSRLARQLYPDVIKGCYVDGELSNPSGVEIIENKAVSELSVEDARKICQDNFIMEDNTYLTEYLEMVKDKVKLPLAKVVETWLANPERFKEKYSEWVMNKFIENKNEEIYKENC